MTLPLFESIKAINPEFPSTRFQGSKRKFVDWIWATVKHLDFSSALDVFGGTGAVSYKFKLENKHVIYNDKLKFNWIIGNALIQNSRIMLNEDDINDLLANGKETDFPKFIQTTFNNIYYYDDENAWLDRIVYNINYNLEDPFKQAIALFALFQSCIIKRPYNLFHRANLYMRSADVERSFGNKSTWDTPFDFHFRVFAKEANNAIFDNGVENLSTNLDALETPVGADLVYIDPPYLNARGIGVDYRDFYHFLEGIANYNSWSNMIDYRSKHKRLKPEKSLWLKPQTNLTAFEDLIALHRKSILIISYRDNGIPSQRQLVGLLSKYKKHVEITQQQTTYALSKRASREILLVGY